ncbi:hypothetical protein GCM10022291_34000 [Postechiella marina]|uniref:Uncharacterized protein n=1 Tax=Postechiella marina TaxID=943941 RepID=A0ABP8CHZ8_9FLAO
MKKSVRILTGILGFIIFVPGLAKFREPFKTFIYKHLTGIGFPLPNVMQYVVKFSEIGVGLALLFLAFKGNSLSKNLREKIFYLGNLTIIIMMVVAVYTHLHPDIPADLLPLEFKPPVMPISYIVLVFLNLYLYKKSNS